MLLVGRSRTTPSGWLSLNCPACTDNGEPTPDKRHRGGLKIAADGQATYNCMRCHFSAHWRPGLMLSQKMQKLLRYLGMDYDEIKKLSFAVWRENQLSGNTLQSAQEYIVKKSFTFDEIQLPFGSKLLSEWVKEKYVPKDCLDVIGYLLSRGDVIAKSYEYYWSPERKNKINRALIVPFYYKDKIVGYSARRIDKNEKVRYLSETPPGFLFLNHNLEKENRKYVIIVEGVFDAIAIDGVAVLGSNLNQQQIQWINNSGKTPIVVPDRTKSGMDLVDVALEQGWLVSIPMPSSAPAEFLDDDKETSINPWLWEENIKDAADSVKINGRLYTIKSILESIQSPTKIEVLKRLYFRS